MFQAISKFFKDPFNLKALAEARDQLRADHEADWSYCSSLRDEISQLQAELNAWHNEIARAGLMPALIENRLRYFEAELAEEYEHWIQQEEARMDAMPDFAEEIDEPDTDVEPAPGW